MNLAREELTRLEQKHEDLGTAQYLWEYGTALRQIYQIQSKMHGTYWTSPNSCYVTIDVDAFLYYVEMSIFLLSFSFMTSNGLFWRDYISQFRGFNFYL